MRDDDSGSDQQGGWQPPEYVSPWISASSQDDKDSGSASRPGEPDASRSPVAASAVLALVPGSSLTVQLWPAPVASAIFPCLSTKNTLT